MIGAPAIHRHVADAGLAILNGGDLAPAADVVVAAAHEGFGYAELREATRALLRGAALLAAGRDATFPMPDGPWPGTGPVVAALEAASGVQARNVGKPEPDLFRTALDRLGPGRALVVGDRLDADVGRAPARRASTAPSCSPAPPTAVAAGRRRARRPRSSPPRWPSSSSPRPGAPGCEDGEPRGPAPPPHRQPPRRRRSRRCARCRPSRRALRDLGFTVRTEQTRDLDHGRALAARPRESGELPVAFSGDGLVGAVAGALRGRPGATLGILPGGRGNDFARVLGIPLEPVEACDVLAAGRPRTVDLGGCRRAAVHRHRQPRLRLRRQPDRQRGAVPPGDAGLRLRRAAGPGRVAARALHRRRRRRPARRSRGWSVGAANSKAYGGGMYAAPEAELDDGALDVVLAPGTGEAALPAAGPAPGLQGHARRPARRSTSCAAPCVRIDADRPFVVYADGDPIAELPVTLTVARDALQVLVPA